LNNFCNFAGVVAARLGPFLHFGWLHPPDRGRCRSCFQSLKRPQKDIVKIANIGETNRVKDRPGVQMKKLAVLSLIALSAFLTNTAAAASNRQDSVDRLQNSGNVLQEVMAAPDKGIPEEVLDGAKCIVIVPHLIKAGFIVGGKHGRGVATCRTANGWSAPAFVSVGGGSWGLQIGVEGVDLVMLIMNDRGLQHLLSSKFELSGEGSAAAGPVGRHASAGTDWKLNTEVLSYSRSKGAFAGITLEGAVVEQDDDSTRAIYGRKVSFHTVLTGAVRPPVSTAHFMAAIRAASGKASMHQAKEEQK
jgi:SH3 domain-containing YSC84-like protein 1